jgi:diguanylate cyclase (GGDEF)-like protein
MRSLLNDLQRVLARWRVEHEQVKPYAETVNLHRVRGISAVVAAINLVCVVWLGLELLLAHDAALARQWKWGLFFTHLCMGLSFASGAWMAHRLRFAARSWVARGLPVVMVSLTLVFCIGFATVDQWMTPAITPFMIGAMAVGLLAYLPPSVSLWIYALAYGLFSYAMGLAQHNADLLMSNRLNGFAAVCLGSLLSLTLWRQFTTMTMQKGQLEEVNAELQTKQKELQRLTRLDGLTGLYNRNTFVALTKDELARAQRQGSSTSILLLDLDFFKRVNDTWGHPAGDAVLKNVAAVANRSVRATDLVGRLGGEEFIILLPATSIDAARRLAEKLRMNLAQATVAWGGKRITSTASIGVASTTAKERRDFDHLYTQADKALYSAKEKGRNRVV